MYNNLITHNKVGGQVLKANVFGIDLFYSNNNIILNKTNRGGVPILFPQFGQNGIYKKHGFVRDIDWNLINEEFKNDLIFIEYECNLNPDNKYNWEYKCKLNYSVKYKNNLLELELKIKNTGSKSFSFTGGLHPYFKINSRKEISILGLNDLEYIDSFPNIESPFNLNGESLIERLYISNSNINFYNGTNLLSLKSKGFDNWMIWNPGKDGSKLINDLPDNDWDKFICIEPIVMQNSINLISGEEFIGKLFIELIN